MSNQHPSVFVNDTTEGIAKVEEGDYAFLLESTQNEYFTERKCDLVQIGGYLDSKGYGVGLPQSECSIVIDVYALESQRLEEVEI